MGFGGLGSRVSGLRFEVKGLGFKVKDLGFGVEIKDERFGTWGHGFGVSAVTFAVWGFRLRIPQAHTLNLQKALKKESIESENTIP